MVRMPRCSLRWKRGRRGGTGERGARSGDMALPLTRARRQRAVPMAALLGVRLAALGARAALRSGSPAALRHYAAMEARGVWGQMKCQLPSCAAAVHWMVGSHRLCLLNRGALAV